MKPDIWLPTYNSQVLESAEGSAFLEAECCLAGKEPRQESSVGSFSSVLSGLQGRVAKGEAGQLFITNHTDVMKAPKDRV